MQSILQELKRRHVLQTAALYIAIAWAATEMLGFLLPALNFPRWTVTIVAIVFVLGFPVAMFLAWAFDVKADGIQRTAPGSAKGKLAISVATLFLLASTVGLFFLLYPDGPEIPTESPMTAFNPPENSIAVLPFVNMSDDADNEYFSDGIAEELLHRLARNGNFWVTARTSSFQFRDREVGVRLIGEQLNVAKVIEGSVRKAGNRVRITVQLINTKDGYHDWSETYDRELTDIFAIQENIAQSVGDELIVRMAVASRSIEKGASGSRVEDLIAYDYYLRGRHALYRDEEPNPSESIELLQLAVDSEPRFAGAWLTLAVAYSMSDETGEEAERLTMESAHKALELDPSLGEAHALIAVVEERRWQWGRAELDFRRALALEPGNAAIHRAYGMFLARTGRTQKSQDQLTAALDRDPVSSESLRNDHTIVKALLRQDKFDEAREFVSKARETHGSWFWPAVVLDALQDTRLVISASAELAKMQEDGRISPEFAFSYQGWLGQWDAAYDNATRSLDDRTFPFPDLWQPAFSQLRQDSRFGGLMKQAGLFEYWEEYGYPDICSPANETIRCD
jgi:TolB-like protein/tetratricopeptide (TPR) repeat protein